MTDCKHQRWMVNEFEVSPGPGGGYAVFLLVCRDCGTEGEYSDHLLNVVQDKQIIWEWE